MTEVTDLTTEITRLRTAEEKNNSLKWNFLRGVVTGLGFFIGSVIIVGIVISLLSLFDSLPIIGDLVSGIVEEAQN